MSYALSCNISNYIQPPSTNISKTVCQQSLVDTIEINTLEVEIPLKWFNNGIKLSRSQFVFNSFISPQNLQKQILFLNVFYYLDKKLYILQAVQRGL